MVFYGNSRPIVRRFIKFALIIGAIVFFEARGADNSVVDKEQGFAITFPDRWTLKEELTGRVKASGSAPFANGAQYIANVNVVVGDIQEGTTLKDFVNNDILPFEKAFNSYKLLEKMETKVGNSAAFKVVFSFANEKVEGILKCTIYYIVKGKRSYSIGATATKDDYEKYTPDFNSIINSFKLLEK